MNRQAYVGLDLGSSSIKVVALDEGGVCVAEAKRPISIRTGPGGVAEQDPGTWHELAGQALRELSRSLAGQSIQVAAAAATGQMNGPVLLDRRGRAAGPVQMWCDSRCGLQCRILEERVEKAQLLETTGHASATGYTAPKLLWLAKHRPEQLEKATHLVFPKDFATRSLTGEIVTDYSDASNSLFLDIHRGEWAEPILRSLDVRLPQLPPLACSAQVIGAVSEEGAAWSGLARGTPVAAGAGDSICAALGAGLRDPSLLQIVVGSAGNVNCVLAEPLIDARARVHTGYFVDTDHWICSAVQQSAGASLRWWSDVTGIDVATLVDEIELNERASAFFAPYLSGERTPHLDPDVRGAFLNLNQHASRADLTRAILEGVAFSFKDAFEVFQELGVKPARAAVSGGGGQSAAWCRIMAAVLGLPLVTGAADTTARGAAMLAACAAGRFESWHQAIDAWSELGDKIEADPKMAEHYRLAYRNYQDLYPRLRGFRPSEAHSTSAPDTSV